ncbi:hypothetical protein [Actinopolymorpha cephalotaxi]
MTFLWAVAGVIVALVVLGILNIRQHRKQSDVVWDNDRGAVQPRVDSDMRTTRPAWGNWFSLGSGGGGAESEQEREERYRRR